MPITAKLDEFGKPAWIALIVLGFMAWWPLGLVVLAFTIGSGRMGCCGYQAGYGGHSRWQHKMERMQRKMDWMRAKMGGGSGASAPWSYGPPSGNRAFDEYRADTLKRLEEEQREFKDFLERLRMAKDKAEFDEFMAERRNRPEPATPPPSPAQN
jgi:Protein of unknown function (DUF2852)